MLLGDDVARLRLELGVELAASGSVFERLARPCCFLNRRQILPRLVVARPIAPVQRVENANAGSPRGIEDLTHVRNAPVGFGDTLQAIPYFPALGNVIVVRVDHNKSGDLVVVSQFCQGLRDA